MNLKLSGFDVETFTLYCGYRWINYTGITFMLWWLVRGG